MENDTVGKIAYIRDTLNRYINFHYDSTDDKKLVAVTVPGYDDSGTPRQTIRFYYDDLELDTEDKFATPVTVTAPETVKVLKFVYFPGTQTGFRYDYSPYFGVISKIWQLRGMVVSSTLLTTTGTVTESNDGSGNPTNWAAMTHYNYPSTSGELDDPITDVPTYTWRKDDWQGRTTSIPQTNFETVEDLTTSCDVSSGTCTGTRITTITAPDGTRNITESLIRPSSSWENGLLDHTRIETGSSPVKVWSKTKFYWEQGYDAATGRDNPRLEKIETTNDTDQTRATSFTYGDYNNVTVVAEHDFDDPGELGTELRRTETTYESGSGWIASRLLHLPTEVKTIVDSTEVSKVQYEYDNYGEDNELVDTPDVVQHDRVFNPENPPEPVPYLCNCHRVCPGENLLPCDNWDWECSICYNNVSVNNYRGNVTKVTAFSDATLTTDTNASVKAMKYDITGNVVESSGGCSCDLTTIEYDDADNMYAYPISVTKTGAGGLESTTSTVYDNATGLVRQITDENGQPTDIDYDPDTLRVMQVDGPDGSRTSTDYNDSTYPYHVQTTIKLDATESVSSWSFINGRGQQFRTRSQTDGGYLSSDIEFDIMGRPVKNFNPYTVATLGGSQPGGLKFTEITERDALGRTLENSLQDETVVTAEYDGLVVTVTDQAGKSRRQVADALGRIIRVDEPNDSGVLGSVGSPNQPTYYEYDGNDNLAKVTQSDGTNTQERLFKYDSLSRMTHERQVEAITTLDDDGEVVTPTSTTWTGVYKYNADSLLIEGFDARGVKSEFDYDGFNRISSVTFTGESGYQTPTVTYTYDQTESGFYNHGRLTKIETESNGTYGVPATAHNFRYDKDGRVKKHTQSIGSENYLQEYTYNLAGQLTSQKLPSGRIIENEIDSLGRLAGVSDADSDYLTDVTFNSQGLVSQLDLGNGNEETFTYNDRFQLISQSLLKSSTVLQKYDYAYGTVADLSDGYVDTAENNGQLSKIEATIGSNKQWSQRFAYDSLGRLKEAREYKGTTSTLSYKQVFDFDRFGNLYRKAANNSTSGQEHPLPYTPIEEATTSNTGDIDKETNRFRTDTTYNEAGMVIEDEKFRDMEFGYDADGRMVKASRTSFPDAWTVYDGLGTRLATKVNDIWRFNIYDAFGKLVAEYGAKSDDVGGVKYVQQDWQGSVRTISNENGFVVARIDHQAFGGDIGYGVGLRGIEQGYNIEPVTIQSYGLTERDDATGLDHAWFRKNENLAGRWTSPDPYNGSMRLGDPQSFNRYSYVNSQPTNFVDPSGLNLTIFTQTVCTSTFEDWIWYLETGEARASNCREVVVHVMNSGASGGVTFESGGVGGGDGGATGDVCPPGPTVCAARKLREAAERNYRDCVDNAWSKYREAHFADGFKTVAGTAIIIGGILYTIFEIRHARSKGHMDRGVASHGVASVGTATLLAGGSLLGDVFFSGRNEAATLKKRIADCKKKYPSANHGYEGGGIIF